MQNVVFSTLNMKFCTQNIKFSEYNIHIVFKPKLSIKRFFQFSWKRQQSLIPDVHSEIFFC